MTKLFESTSQNSHLCKGRYFPKVNEISPSWGNLGFSWISSLQLALIEVTVFAGLLKSMLEATWWS